MGLRERLTYHVSPDLQRLGWQRIPEKLLEAQVAAVKRKIERIHPQFPDAKGYATLKDIPTREELFTPISGAIKLRAVPTDPTFAEFYSSERIDKNGNEITNRGANYYVAIDEQKVTHAEKIQTIQSDIAAGLKILQEKSRPTETSSEEFLLYLGVLDYVKNGFLTAYNALTFNEKSGKPKDTSDGYKKYRSLAEKLAVQSTRMFYQTCMGQPYDPEFNLYDFRDETNDLFSYLQGESHPVKSDQYKIAEIDHPLRIIDHALLNTEAHPKTNLILGLLTGGAQPAIATQVAYDSKGHYTELQLLRFSLYSAQKAYGKSMELPDAIAMLEPYKIEGNHVLAIDDNVYTGATLQVIADAIEALEAKSVSISVPEMGHTDVIKQKLPKDANGVYTMIPKLTRFPAIVGERPRTIDGEPARDGDAREVLMRHYTRQN